MHVTKNSLKSCYQTTVAPYYIKSSKGTSSDSAGHTFECKTGVGVGMSGLWRFKRGGLCERFYRSLLFSCCVSIVKRICVHW